MTPTDLLDGEELLHLALQAMDRQEPGRAMEYLKRVLIQEPDHPEAHYLLGALLAQIGLVDRARTHMARAVQLQPGLDVARFQLGWLELNAGDAATAASTWAPLEGLGESHPFVLFKNGLLLLARDELAESISTLERGLLAEPALAALNADMSHLIAQLKRRQSDMPAEGPAVPAADDDVPAMFLDAYTTRAH